MGKFTRLMRMQRRRRHRAIVRLSWRALRDDRGGEVLEYAVVAGLMFTAVIGVVSCVGTKVMARWTSLNASL